VHANSFNVLYKPGETPAGQSSSPRRGSKVQRSMSRSSAARPDLVAMRGDKDDGSVQRVLRTPRVFQSSRAGVSNRRQRELRANLLPSIVRWPESATAVLATTASGAPDSPTVDTSMGDFHRHYKERLEQRAQEENEIGLFLERDQSFPSVQREPQQIVVASCTVLKELVADHQNKFRRTHEGLVNTTSDLPFTHVDQGVDLQELANVLTLDLERREFPFKGSVKRPGFLSLQLTSRVPVVVRDPVATTGLTEVESERLAADLHMIRLDLQPGEVRQVAYSMDGADFRRTELAERMAALVDPERGVLAGLVRALRAKESEAKALGGVLNDILRDLPDSLPAAPSPRLDKASDEDAKAARLSALVAEPRRTLSRLLEASESLAALAAPLVPSLAQAMDRLALICVREVDRLAARCHEDYERLYSLWAQTEGERRELVSVIDRMGGTAGGSGGVELRNRVAKLQLELAQQEQLYSNLLQEKNELQVMVDEGCAAGLALRRKVHELQCEIGTLHRAAQQHAQSSRPSAGPDGLGNDTASTASGGVAEGAGSLVAGEASDAADASTPRSTDAVKETAVSAVQADISEPLANLEPDLSTIRMSVVVAPLSDNKRTTIDDEPKDTGADETISRKSLMCAAPRHSMLGNSGSRQSKSPRSTIKSSQEITKLRTGSNVAETINKHGTNLFAFTVPKGTQTDTEYMFSDNPVLEDELEFGKFEHMLKTSNRIFVMLCKYEWSAVASKYFIRSADTDDSDEDAPANFSMPKQSMLMVSPREKQPYGMGRGSYMHCNLGSVSPKKNTVLNAKMALITANRMSDLQSLKLKVERAHRAAHLAQMEEEVSCMQACMKEGFQKWIYQAVRKGRDSDRFEDDKDDSLPQHEELWRSIVELIQTEGMRRRIRELEDHLSSLLPLAERARGSNTFGEGGGDTTGGGDSCFWKRVMRTVRQSTMTRRGSSVAKAQLSAPIRRRSSLGVSTVNPSMDVSRLLAEIGGIWASLLTSRVTEVQSQGTVVARTSQQKVLQGCIKSFYLRKSGRSKYVEAAVVALCRSVLDHCGENTKIALFAVMADIQPATILGAKVPKPRRESPPFVWDPAKLNELPLDGAYAIATFMRELKSLRRSRRYLCISASGGGHACPSGNLGTAPHEDMDVSVGNSLLPAQLVLAAGTSVLGTRSRSTIKFFQLALYGYFEFSNVQELKKMILVDDGSGASNEIPKDDSSVSFDTSSETTRQTNTDDPDARMTPSLGCSFDEARIQEFLHVSHILGSYIWQESSLPGRCTEDDPEGVTIDALWVRLLDDSSVGQIRRSLGLGAMGTISAQKLARLLVQVGIVNLPVTMVLRAVVTAALRDVARENPEALRIQHADFLRLARAWHYCGVDGGTHCSEGLAMWAALWALGYERSTEIDFMGELFNLFDASGDGWLQFDEFLELIQAIVPEVTRANTEELFLCGAEEVTGDMTKEVFIGLVLRLGITSNVNMLEDLVAAKKAALFGYVQDPL